MPQYVVPTTLSHHVAIQDMTLIKLRHPLRFRLASTAPPSSSPYFLAGSIKEPICQDILGISSFFFPRFLSSLLCYLFASRFSVYRLFLRASTRVIAQLTLSFASSSGPTHAMANGIVPTCVVSLARNYHELRSVQNTLLSWELQRSLNTETSARKSFLGACWASDQRYPKRETARRRRPFRALLRDVEHVFEPGFLPGSLLSPCF